LSFISSGEHPHPGRLAERNVPVVEQSAITVKTTAASAAHDDDDCGEAQRRTVPRPQTQFLTVDDMKQADCIETLASDKDSHCV